MRAKILFQSTNCGHDFLPPPLGPRIDPAPAAHRGIVHGQGPHHRHPRGCRSLCYVMHNVTCWWDGLIRFMFYSKRDQTRSKQVSHNHCLVF